MGIKTPIKNRSETRQHAAWISDKAGGNPLAIFNPERYGISRETMAYYYKVIGPKLKDALNALNNDENFLDVSEEVSHMRLIHQENLRVLGMVYESRENMDLPEETRNKCDITIRELAPLIANSAEGVIRAVERAAKIQVSLSDKANPHTTEILTRQICQFVYRAFDAPDIQPGDSLQVQQDKIAAKLRIQHFDKMMNEELQLPSLKALGTSITPDQQVLAMDATIPSAPPQEIED